MVKRTLSGHPFSNAILIMHLKSAQLGIIVQGTILIQWHQRYVDLITFVDRLASSN